MHLPYIHCVLSCELRISFITQITADILARVIEAVITNMYLLTHNLT